MTKTLSEIQREFGRELRKTRLKYNLSYGYIAKQLKCSPALLNAVESGYACLSISNIARISNSYFHKFGRNDKITDLGLKYMIFRTTMMSEKVFDLIDCNSDKFYQCIDYYVSDINL